MSNLKCPYFRSKQPGHFAAQCPTRSLAIDNQENDKEGEIQEETYDPPTIDDVVEEDEEYDQLTMIKLSQPTKPDLLVV